MAETLPNIILCTNAEKNLALTQISMISVANFEVTMLYLLSRKIELIFAIYAMFGNDPT